MRQARTPVAPRSLARFVLPFAAAGIVVGCVAVLLQGTQPSAMTVSQAQRQVREIILRQASTAGGEDGGPVGPWWVSARSADPMTGTFRDFKLTSGALHMAAKSAELHINPDTDMFSFHLVDVVMTRVLEDGSEPAERGLHQIESYVLGPVPWGDEIVRDGTLATAPPSGAPPATP